MKITVVQKDIISVLISLRIKERPIRGEEIAEILQRDPGTIRNQMQLLKSIGLVEGIVGPLGGYKPTGSAYDALHIQQFKNESTVHIYRNGNIELAVTATEINFVTLEDKESCDGNVRIIGSIKSFAIDDKILIGPTSVNHLIIRGTVTGKDNTNNSILFNITEIISLPKKQVKNCMIHPLLLVNLNSSIQEVTRFFIKNNVDGALVEDKGKIVGIVTYTDIAHAFFLKKIKIKVKDIMIKELITIDGNLQLYDALKLFNRYNIGRLVVTIDGVPKGTLSNTDLMNELVSSLDLNF